MNVVFLCITAPYTMRSQWVLVRTDKGQIYRTNRVSITSTKHQIYKEGTTTSEKNNKNKT